MSDVIRWEDPPAHGNLKGVDGGAYGPIAMALRARPGDWAVILEGITAGTAGPLVGRIRNGYGPFAPKGDFEAMSRIKDGQRNVYARYVGGS